MVIYCGMWISLVYFTVSLNCEAEHFLLFCISVQYSKIVWTFIQVSLTLCIPWENGYCCCIVTDDATHCIVISLVLEKFSVDWKVLELNSFLPLWHDSFKVLAKTDGVRPQFTQSWHSCTTLCYFPVYLQEDRMFFVGLYLTFSCNIHLSPSPALCAIPLPLCHSCSVNFSFTNIAVRGC